MAWMILAKKFGPWIAVALLLVGIYYAGGSKWRVKHKAAIVARDAAIVHRDAAVDRAALCAVGAEQVRAALTKQNNALRELGQLAAEREAAVRLEGEVALRRQADAYRRALRDATEATADLRLRIEEMSVAEACHESWLEVMG